MARRGAPRVRTAPLSRPPRRWPTRPPMVRQSAARRPRPARCLRRSFAPRCRPSSNRICLRALARDPADRFQTAAEMQGALEAVLASVGFRREDGAIAAVLARGFSAEREAGEALIRGALEPPDPILARGTARRRTGPHVAAEPDARPAVAGASPLAAGSAARVTAADPAASPAAGSHAPDPRGAAMSGSAPGSSTTATSSIVPAPLGGRREGVGRPESLFPAARVPVGKASVAAPVGVVPMPGSRPNGAPATRGRGASGSQAEGADAVTEVSELLTEIRRRRHGGRRGRDPRGRGYGSARRGDCRDVVGDVDRRHPPRWRRGSAGDVRSRAQLGGRKRSGATVGGDGGRAEPGHVRAGLTRCRGGRGPGRRVRIRLPDHGRHDRCRGDRHRRRSPLPAARQGAHRAHRGDHRCVEQQPSPPDRPSAAAARAAERRSPSRGGRRRADERGRRHRGRRRRLHGGRSGEVPARVRGGGGSRGRARREGRGDLAGRARPGARDRRPVAPDPARPPRPSAVGGRAGRGRRGRRGHRHPLRRSRRLERRGPARRQGQRRGRRD